MPHLGRAGAHGGLGLVNAIGSGGYGAAAAIDLPVIVEVKESETYHGESLTRGRRLRLDPVIVESIAKVAEAELGVDIRGLELRVYSTIPLEAGLKGSSAIINAGLAALMEAYGVKLDLLRLARLGVKAARMAGLTITGALDDHMAVSGCGAYATDNIAQRVVAVEPQLKAYVAIIVRGRRSIREINPDMYKHAHPLFRYAWKLAIEGRWWEAAVVNGAAMLMSMGGTLPNRLRVDADILGFGVSGKGPSLYIVSPTLKRAIDVASAVREEEGGEIIVSRVVNCPSGETPSYKSP
ncbi:MAG: shikimate kinase [Hyperthermus sp.]|nr:MAG: shikimate kinase [Hyperthermus sp.]